MRDAFEAAIAGAVDAALARWREATAGSHGPAEPLAVGWTTVESERAEPAIVAAGRGAVGPFVDAADDAVIGARCRVTGLSLASLPQVYSLVLLEPSTEGLLAASLARIGEGPAVVWVAAAVAAGAGLAPTLSTSAAGPFGPERLVLGGARDGRLLLVVDDAPGTIAT